MTKLSKGRRAIMNKQTKKTVAKGVKNTLDMVLRTEANTASCVIMYQPKAPKELMKFRKSKE